MTNLITGMQNLYSYILTVEFIKLIGTERILKMETIEEIHEEIMINSNDVGSDHIETFRKTLPVPKPTDVKFRERNLTRKISTTSTIYTKVYSLLDEKRAKSIFQKVI
jgi:hypothetical protein